jgi:hypothetical protein
MKITLFTNNQARHTSLIESMAEIAKEVYVIQECSTFFPGRVKNDYHCTEVVRKYFDKVIGAEELVFGKLRFCPRNIRYLFIKSEDLNLIDLDIFEQALHSNAYIVFGSSYIKGPLLDFLIKSRAYNIHMGISPYYRGSSCNFWPLYDGRPDLVGATIHLLSRELDSGPIMFHAFPRTKKTDPFVLGMQAVLSAHKGLAEHLLSGELKKMKPVEQDKSLEIRYTRNSDFTDQVVAEYSQMLPSPGQIEEALEKRNPDQFIRPFIK